MSGWIEAARRVPVADVATRLGLTVAGRASTWITPCPACGRTHRNASTASEKRGPISVFAPDAWRCLVSSCEVGGDGIDLVAASMFRRRFRDLAPTQRSEVRAWFDRQLGCAAPSPARAPAPRPQAPAAPSPPARPLPPRAELLAVLNELVVPVTDDPEVSRYLASRGIDAERVAMMRAAFALPAGEKLPRWARSSAGFWSFSGHRLITPLFDATGRVQSVIARRVCEGETPKSLFPMGFGRAGLVMACKLGRALLSLGTLPIDDEVGTWWAEETPRLRVIVVEGDSDFLASVSGPLSGVRWSDADEYSPAVLGVESGSWTEEIAARIPDGAHVSIATDADAAGAKYAATVAATFASRPSISLTRWRPAWKAAA